MQKPLLSVLLLAALCACKKDEEQPTSPADNTTTLEVQVYNTLNWSPSQPYGTLEPAVTVQLFKTRESFNGNAPAYSQTTDANGKATFAKIDTGLYYIIARNENASNLVDATLKDGVYIGYLADSLYQTAEDVAAGPVNSYGRPGNFMLADLNADGKIDASDKTVLPAQSVAVAANATSTKRILIGKLENRPDPNFANEAAVNEAVQRSLVSLSKWHELQVLLDAVYTDDYDCEGLGADWCAINSYTELNPDNSVVTQFWKDGFQLVSQLNRIIIYTDKIQDPNMTAAEKEMVISRASGLKEYIYFQLLTYFEAVPLLDSIDMPVTANNNASTDEIVNFMSHLSAIAGRLPVTDPVFNTNASLALLAKIYMKYGYYRNAAIAAGIVAVGPYELLADTSSIFTQAANKEIIWNTSGSLQTLPLQTLFKRGQFLPEIRLAEVTFMEAEIAFETGDLPNSVDKLNKLLQRENRPLITYSADPGFRDVLREAIYTSFTRHMRLEGLRFEALKRWNRLTPVLEPLGFNDRNKALPIPNEILIQYPNMHQNVGY
ncbi:RagB/SusD family nutrient uptake outer membrane protein [uncultured Chitinophaga sp.]|uniref:RagB/SusD family nutrient uptake outer membrane protein n=1 Tax=uncultured Chitinophaga sp. TaxID=339340 RepID=UPI00262C001E|nr:RagB/SusD family nutrient uptake outer membrane protein [uncultured Chitinophaga sp.]